jgi:hypothetical protein
MHQPVVPLDRKRVDCWNTLPSRLPQRSTQRPAREQPGVAMQISSFFDFPPMRIENAI